MTGVGASAQDFCRRCGADVSGSRFCPNCGQPLEPGNLLQRIPAGRAFIGASRAGTPYEPRTDGRVEVPGVGTLTLATIPQRAIARVLDVILIGLAGLIVVAIFATVASAIAGASTANAATGSGYTGDAGLGAVAGALVGVLIGLLFVAALAYCYEVAMVSIFGRTVGKMIMGIRIIRQQDGTKPTFGVAVVRWLAPGLGGLIPLVGGLGEFIVLLSAAFDSSGRRQGWHDRIAATLVVSTRRAAVGDTP